MIDAQGLLPHAECLGNLVCRESARLADTSDVSTDCISS